MTFIIGLYLLVDVLQHKGQTRILFPVNFPGPAQQQVYPRSTSTLINSNQIWKKAINTKEKLDALHPGIAGFECDVYFDTATRSFNIHHDPGKSTGYNLDELLRNYRAKKLTASIWLDLKNLDDSNAAFALRSLVEIRNTYKLDNKILVESHRADLLTAFSDNGFYTAYYTPFINPYKAGDAKIKNMADSLSQILQHAKINALSGYYFQYPFLQHYFPNYPVLLWADKSSFSLINWMFRRKISNNNNIAIALYP